jgi:hypothetical protein
MSMNKEYGFITSLPGRGNKEGLSLPVWYVLSFHGLFFHVVLLVI